MPVVPAHDNLMTAKEFNRRVKLWGENVRAKSYGSLVAMTDVYSGKLRGNLKDVISKARDDGTASWVGFRFERYGVFVAYGVGRGWIRQGGVVMRGSRVRKGSELYHQLKSKGYSRKDLREYVIKETTPRKPRVPKDWLDKNIDANIESLADIAGEYYGDASMQHVLDEFDRIKINKTPNS